MIGNLGNMANMMKAAKNIKNGMKDMQENLKNVEVTHSSDDGNIEVTVTGDFSIKRINIQPNALMLGEEMLADLITATTNNALNEVKLQAKEQVSALTGGLDIPGLF